VSATQMKELTDMIDNLQTQLMEKIKDLDGKRKE
jgi:hypothetical protein